MRSRGFTLIELLIAVTIAGLVLLVTVPSFGSYLKDLNNKKVRTNLISDLRVARQLAVTEHRPVVVRFGTTSSTTDITTYSIHIDTNGDRIVQAGESFYQKNLPSGTKFTKVSLTPNDSLIFDISGVLWPSTTGGWVVVNGRSRNDTLYVSAAGIVFQP